MNLFKYLLPVVLITGVHASGSSNGAAVGNSAGQVSNNESSFKGRSQSELIKDIKANQGVPKELNQHKAWSKILKKNVEYNKGKTATKFNYKNVNLKEVKNYTSLLLAYPKSAVDNMSVEDQKAYYFNLYNALTVELIKENYPLESIKELGSGFPLFQSPWKRKFFTLFGELSHLDRVEHELTRGNKKLADPLVHFAFNCASIGCPALLDEAFVGDRLEKQMQTATKNFLRDRKRNYFKDGILYVSPIFKWYKGDFESGLRGYKSLKAFFKDYRRSLSSDPSVQKLINDFKYEIKYLDYDWNLNSNF